MFANFLVIAAASITVDQVTPPPAADCRRCRGLGLVPRDPLPVYVHVGVTRDADPEQSVAHRFCPLCQSGSDNALLVRQERSRLRAGDARHRSWQQRLQTDLLQLETHSLAIYSQLPEETSRRAAAALEALTRHLQQSTGSLLLTPRRPASDEMLLLADQANYERFLEELESSGRYAWVNWHLMRKRIGSTIDHTSFLYSPPQGPPIENIAVYSSAYRQIQIAAGERAPVWLCDGFAAHCEFAVLRTNLMHAIAAQSRRQRIVANWPSQLRRLARSGGLLGWEELLAAELAEFQTIHYLQAKSIVDFLLNEPDSFLDFVEALSAGTADRVALEESFSKPLAELEKAWRRELGFPS